MELKALRAFLKVAETGSMSQAATSLGLTQSSLSRIVGGLERELGSVLFHRTGRGVALTEAGAAALSRTRNILLETDALAVSLRESGQGLSGMVTLGLMQTLTAGIAGPLFEEVRRLHPGIRLRLLEGFSANIAEWLAEGRADIALVSRYRKSDALKDEVLKTSHLMLVGYGEAARGGREIGFREVARLPLVLPAPPNATRLAVDRAARHLGMALNVAIEADSLEAQKAIISRPECFTLLDLQAVEREVARGQIHARPVVAPRIQRLVVISTTPQRPLSQATKGVIDIIRRLHGSESRARRALAGQST